MPPYRGGGLGLMGDVYEYFITKPGCRRSYRKARNIEVLYICTVQYGRSGIQTKKNNILEKALNNTFTVNKRSF